MADIVTTEAPEVRSRADRSDNAEPDHGEQRKRQRQAAALVFGLFVAVGAWALVTDLGRYYWFHGDDWDFLVERDGGDLGDLLHPHNEHLTLLPIIVWRVLWNLFGLRSYLPYQIPAIALHLTAAVLLRALMRRASVNPWIATAAAAVFVLFGPGEENIVWAFQIAFTGSLVCGIGQLLLADHAGPFGRRDWLALGVGALGLLCSGLTPITAGVVGLVVLVRRGWRPAAFQTVPLGIAYATWWLAVGPETITDPYLRSTGPGDVLHFVKTGLVATFEGLGGSATVGALLALILIGGLAVAWVPLPRGERLRSAVMPLSLLLAGIAFLAVSGYGRWWVNRNVGSSSRYVHLVAAFTLPALAVAADALARRWRFGIPIAVLVFVSVIPHNIGEFETNPPFGGPYFDGRRELIAALARSEYITEVPRTTRPDVLWSTVTADWLLDALEADDLPDLENARAADDPSFRLRFGLSVIEAPTPGGDCREIREPVVVSLRKGDELGVKVGPWSEPRDGWYFTQSYTMQLIENGQPVGLPLTVHPDYGHLLRAELDDLEVRFALAPGTEAFILCR